MAYLFLKGSGAPAVVSEVDLDAAELWVRQVENAEIEGLTAGPGGPVFFVKASALPFPLAEEVEAVLSGIPFHEDLNREMLRVTGLTAGRYMLSIDDEEIGLFDAEELAHGINLASKNWTPQARQAREILHLARRWHELLCRDLRVLAQAEHWHLMDVPRTTPPEDVRSALQEKMKLIDGSTVELDRYNVGIMERYLVAKPREARTRALLAHFLERIRKEARPKTRRYELCAVS